MLPYQSEYLELLRFVAENKGPSAGEVGLETYVEQAQKAAADSRSAVQRGTELLREHLFPVLGDILSASDEEVAALEEFAGKLMSGVDQRDVGLHYRIHTALLSRARRRKDRDAVIRELYLVGMSLYNMDTMLRPSENQLFALPMRQCFEENAAHFDTDYDEIEEPETRGYIHRSIGNIALGYSATNPDTAGLKLEAITRSIDLITDPEIRAKTPSLPWDLYLYKSHQERTTLLGYLRSGNAGPDVFAQVLESALAVQEKQIRTARERGVPLEPRWQYTYVAALYHCGAMSLQDLLDKFYALSTASSDEDMGDQGIFCHLGLPGMFLGYAKFGGEEIYTPKFISRMDTMLDRMCRWLVRAPMGENSEHIMFYVREFLYVFREFPGCLSFFELLQNVFAARHAATYIRMWIAGRIARELALWASDDCPEALVGLPGCRTPQDAVWHREELAELAGRAGRLYDTGMVHFLYLESSACRGLFEEEEALIRFHTECGAELLAKHPSTELFADVARGHHRSFDGKDGYPDDFSIRDPKAAPLICLVAVSDLLAASVEETASRYRPVVPFDEALEILREERGTQYAPFVVDLLATPERQELLRRQLEIWKQEAYLDMYDRRERMLSR